MEDRLKPCPFCGGEAGYTNAQLPNGTEVYYIECLECGASSAVYGTAEKACREWNTRKPMDRIVEQLEKLPYKTKTIMRESKEVPEYFETVRVDKYIRQDKAIEIVKAV